MLPTGYKITSNVCSSTRKVLPSSRPVFLLWQHAGWSTQHSYTALLPDRMWVRELSCAQPCSKTAPFISPVTRLCNTAVWMCIVGGGWEGAVFAFHVFVSVEVTVWLRGANLMINWQRFIAVEQDKSSTHQLIHNAQIIFLRQCVSGNC